MNQYLYKLNLIERLCSDESWTKEDREIITEHFNHLVALTEKRVALIVGRTNREYEDGFGIVIFKAPDWDSANEIMNADPAIARGIMKGTLFEYNIALESLTVSESE